MKAVIEIALEGAHRTEITDKLSTAMGSFITAIGKPDLSTWSGEDWDNFMGVAFDVVAPAVFLKRLVLVPPFDTEKIPF